MGGRKQIPFFFTLLFFYILHYVTLSFKSLGEKTTASTWPTLQVTRNSCERNVATQSSMTMIHEKRSKSLFCQLFGGPLGTPSWPSDWKWLCYCVSCGVALAHNLSVWSLKVYSVIVFHSNKNIIGTFSVHSPHWNVCWPYKDFHHGPCCEHS